MKPFHNREEAGQYLAGKLSHYADDPYVLVLALPRGGVPVAFEVARMLRAPLDVFLVRKLGVPGHEELAMGAIASGGMRVLNRDVVDGLRIPEAVIDRVAALELRELERRAQAYRDDRPLPDVREHIIVLVDDGLATGSTMRVAARAVQQQQPARLIIAVPVAAPETCADLRNEADEIVCAMMPQPFRAVGYWYEDFSQTTDAQVRALLAQASMQQRVA